MDPLLEPPKRKRTKYHLNYFVEPQKKPKQERFHSYVRYASTQSGGVSAAQSSLHTTAVIESEVIESEDVEAQGGNAESIDSNESNWVDEQPALDQAYLEHIEETATDERPKRDRPKGDETLRQWEPHCDLFLEELLGHDGRGHSVPETCTSCDMGEATHECIDCHGRQMKCSSCVVRDHVPLPFHKLRKWNGTFFEDCSLKQLGLLIQLGHPLGEICLNPEQPPDDDFTVIDSKGILSVGLRFCGCGKSSQDHKIQLLRARLFPATIKYPKTAATFECLDYFSKLSYVSKISAFDFIQTASRLTDDTGTNPPKDRYMSFIRMAHEYRHLKMLKRSGRGHDPSGVAKTKEGECAVLCPACPQPERNMKPGWEDEPEDRQYLYALFLALNANFRLKRKNVSNDGADPGLCKGWAYVVEETKYKAHLKRHIEEVEPKSTCSRHDAVNLAGVKPGDKNLSASGGGTVVCARHDMKRPNSFGDLQRGERYCNMDYIFYQSIRNSHKIKTFIISYDIACQWSINIKERMSTYDHEFFFLDGRRYIRYLVPKFHLPAHVAACLIAFSFNFTRGVGRTEGEAPERGWSNTNALAPSTKEMGPGSRRDTLDYHFGDHNWRKVTSIGASLRRKLISAATDMAEQTIAHNELSSTLPQPNLDLWTKQVEAWEKDPKQPNPFETKVKGPTQAAVRKELAEEEAKNLAIGKDYALDDKVLPSVLIAAGIDLEAEQRSLAIAVKQVWAHARDRQRTKVQLRSNALQRKIDSWCQFQLLYCPGVATLRGPASSTAITPHLTPLWLPSQIKGQIPVNRSLVDIEWKIRHAQAFEALESIRHFLQVRAYLYKFKDRFVRGQGANTRANNDIAGVQAKLDVAVAEYRIAYNALLSLSSQVFESGWKDQLLPLKDEDVRDLSEGKTDKYGKRKQSEGMRTISWIWKAVPAEELDNDDVLRERVRIEWCKSRARACRFTEEVALLIEEMHRVLRFLEWKAQDWIVKGELETWPGEMSKIRTEGLHAYANRQAAILRAIAQNCWRLWQDLPAHVSRMQSIIADPSLAEEGEFDSSKASRTK